MKNFGVVAPIVFAMVVTIAARSDAQTQWQKFGGNPVISAAEYNGVYGGFDEQAVVQGFIMEDQGVLRLWYVGMDAGYKKSVGEAISIDGIHWYGARGIPSLSPGAAGSFDELGISKASVVRDEDGYKMYYASGPDFHNKIGVATSTDGYTWTKYSGNPIVDWGGAGEWDDQGAWAPMVIYENQVYKMWYQGYDGTYSSVGYATSTDGFHWTKYSGNPVLLHGNPGDFDYLTAGEANVLRAQGKYHMFYTSTDASIHNNVGYAVSQDGIAWTKYQHNPVVAPGPSLWDGANTAAASVIFKNNQFRMWYTGWAGGLSQSIGYATAPVDHPDIGVKIRQVLGVTPTSVQALGNYPNPFNPETEIQFGIPADGKTKIVIYDVNGRAVKTVVDQEMVAGLHSVVWNGMNASNQQVSSGTYFYRVEFAGHDGRVMTDTKKMNYMK